MSAGDTVDDRVGVPTAIMTGLGTFGGLAGFLASFNEPTFATIWTASLVIAVTFAVLFILTVVCSSTGAARRALEVGDTAVGVWPMGLVGTIAASLAPMIVVAFPSAGPVALLIVGVAWVFHAKQALRRSPSA